MQDHGSTFCDYVEAVIRSVPCWGYGIALGIFIIGSAIAFIKKGRNKGLRISAQLFLLFYVVVLFCSTVFFRTTTTIIHSPFDFFWHYEVIGQQWSSLFPEILLNVSVFFPIGFAFGMAFRKLKGWQVVLAGMGISVGIEMLQWFFRKGFADVDDVMHNVLGCLLGYLVYWIVKRGMWLRGEN